VTGGTVLGIGIDLVENKEMADILSKWKGRFKDRVFLRKEQRYCDSKALPVSHYAGRFAVKEAVTKAFGTGVGSHISWLDIEVLRDPKTGAPSVKLSPKAMRLSAKRKASSILISLAHTRHYAVAHAVLLGGAPSRKVRRRKGAK
jgi:holo-[acyl-carrier protein] synthase